MSTILTFLVRSSRRQSGEAALRMEILSKLSALQEKVPTAPSVPTRLYNRLERTSHVDVMDLDSIMSALWNAIGDDAVARPLLVELAQSQLNSAPSRALSG